MLIITSEMLGLWVRCLISGVRHYPFCRSVRLESINPKFPDYHAFCLFELQQFVAWIALLEYYSMNTKGIFQSGCFNFVHFKLPFICSTTFLHSFPVQFQERSRTARHIPIIYLLNNQCFHIRKLLKIPQPSLFCLSKPLQVPLS
jgi:hypothetical protein